jgi:predicted nucleotidyltransferase
MLHPRGYARFVRRNGIAKIARRYGCRAVILFGSRARGDARPDSDCDICVSAPDFRGDEIQLAHELSVALGEDVDLCRFERIGPALMYTVVTEGRLLYGSQDTFDRLQCRGIKEWQDSYKQVEAAKAYLDAFE